MSETMDATTRRSGGFTLRAAAWMMASMGVVSVLIYALFSGIHYEWNWAAAWQYRGLFWKGWLTTLAISAGAMAVSLLVGLLLMAGRRSRWMLARLLCGGVVEMVRGTPLLVQLLIGYYVVARQLEARDPLLTGMVLLGLFEGAYLAEIFRGAVESIGASQWEAARAVGLDRVGTYRWVILPQALRRALPGTAGQLVSLIKDSSLLSVIGIEELVQQVRILNSASYTALEGYLPLALAYLVVTLPLSRWAQGLERRFHYET
ncbi:MAG: amino acid ABC transporter permease [Verrucomicrobiales bacterium]|nr:amino acid ABC transporter permease [Verrucomicrobiales bacterium]